MVQVGRNTWLRADVGWGSLGTKRAAALGGKPKQRKGSCPARALVCGSTAPAFTMLQREASQECHTVRWAAGSLRLQGPCTGYGRSALSHAWPHATAPHQTDIGAPVLVRPAQVPRHADGLMRCVQDGELLQQLRSPAQQLQPACLRLSAPGGRSPRAWSLL